MKKILSLTALLLTLIACTTTKTAIFDHYSYQKTTEIKIETIHLLNKATEPYENHTEAIQKLKIEIEKLIEYEKNKPNNEITYAMWLLINDKEKNLLASFLEKWNEKQKITPAFIQEAKQQITEAFDLLIQYETKKDKETTNLLLNLIKTK